MAPFVVYRSPGQSVFFLDSKGAGTFFDFCSFDLSTRYSLEGTPCPISEYDWPNFPIIASKELESDTFLTYKNKFKQYQKAFQRDGIQKAILSRAEVVEMEHKEVSIKQLFMALEGMYPEAFVYLLFHPEVGMWAGATPELLAKKNGKVVNTVALAGTKLKASNREWTKKEIIEQELVQQYIKTLHSDNYNLIHISETETIKAAHLEHLCTKFTFQIESEDFDTFLNKLHPTPAVCGLPKKAAMQLIKNVEQYDRHLYTGVVGVREDQDLTYYVNLRCMQLTNAQTIIYVGGGITADSQCAKEWEETVQKANVMRNVLKVIS